MTGYEPLIMRQDWSIASDRDWVNVLVGLRLFEGVGRRELRRVVSDAEFAEFAPGDTVVGTGAPPDYFYVILSGEASPTARPAGRPLKTGDYFGEMALLENGRRSASVVATSELHVMRLARTAFDAALARNPSLARTMLVELASRVRELEHQLA